ncbi:hypothetical protein Taro_047297 [Colocasia esculenta]|uniref:Protein kinase domain-containing protein n=1 Tax=Colocasia esculenta TaxID=4460 RepID=A0A843X3N5_COLES|nr:hypothetical protein [Colocasia esculenta]
MLGRGSKTRFLRRNRRLIQEKQAAFSMGGSRNTSQLFTAAELEEATDRYHPRRLIKLDGSHELYRATLGGQAVSVKRASPEAVRNCQGNGGGVEHLVEGMVTEIVVLSGVGHRNVAKLLGCCLETQVPALVYHLDSHGTLQGRAFAGACPSGADLLTWPSRLRAAAEVAGALHYLHRHAPVTIVHRDVKPSSVVLDEQGVPKLVDFSLSMPIPPNQTEAGIDIIAGNIYYIDPESSSTCTASEKSDVYSFGMLLLVLMLGKHPSEWEEENGFPLLSRLGSGEGEIAELVGRDELVAMASGMGEAEGKVEQLWEFADLAFECLRRRGEERPTMKETERRLREISSLMP